MATITLYELGGYNDGRLIAGTFNLDNSSTYGEWMCEVGSWLARMTQELGRLCEEWIIADAEGVPDQFVGEYSLDAVYWEYRDALATSYLDEEVFMAASVLEISPSMVEALYQGEFESDREFAFCMAEDLDLLNKEAQWPYTCIDWDTAARELLYDYEESNGHYFRTDY
ncbi:MAG: antirestriction protein ArdA [Pseudomonadota bacterium]